METSKLLFLLEIEMLLFRMFFENRDNVRTFLFFERFGGSRTLQPLRILKHAFLEEVGGLFSLVCYPSSRKSALPNQ